MTSDGETKKLSMVPAIASWMGVVLYGMCVS